MLQAGRLLVPVPNKVDFFNIPNPSSHTMALGLTQPLTEMSTTNLPDDKSSRHVELKSYCHLPAECLKMWEPQPLATLGASMACTGIA
jgi:hypothetical protein